MKIFLGSDHGGFELKEQVKSFLTHEEHDIEDCGALVLDPRDDYPDFIEKAARSVVRDKRSIGIVFGKSGAGESIAANKVKGIRAVIGFSPENVQLAREDNDANVLSLGSAFVSFEKAKELISLFIATPFSEAERHKRRIEKIAKIENSEL